MSYTSVTLRYCACAPCGPSRVPIGLFHGLEGEPDTGPYGALWGPLLDGPPVKGRSLWLDGYTMGM